MKKMNKNKNDEIELKETKDNNQVHMTVEESRKIIPKEVEKLKFILSNNSHITKYCWDVEGEKIINDTKIFFTREEKKILKYLLLKKIPEKHRPNFWLIASGARREILNNKKYYKNLSENFPEVIPSPYENQIEMDLHRTFPGDPYFQKEENLTKLKNVLLAYSRRNISIGYCQGFNFIVGRLLKVYDNEEEAFWVFVQLIEHILPINYYSELAGIMIDCSILIKLIKTLLPSLYNHLINIGYELSLNNVLYKWFVSVFIQNLSLDLSMIVWDLLFLEGNIIMFKSALGILKIIKKSILSRESLEDINEAFDEGTKHLNDHQSLIYYLVARKFEFDYEFICKNRCIFQTAILENIIKNNENKILRVEDKSGKIMRRGSYVKNVVECFHEWPLCIYDNSYKYNVVNFLIFRTFDPPNFIEDFYFDHVNYNRGWNFIDLASGKFSDSDYVTSRRKSSKSTDDFQKINLNYSDSKINFNFTTTHSYPTTNLNSPKSDIDNYEIKLSHYNNLLIERRKHFCPGKIKSKEISEDHEVLINGEFKVDDSYMKIEEKKIDDIDLMVSGKPLTKRERKFNNSSIKSQSMMKSSFLILQSMVKEESYCNVVNGIDYPDITDSNLQIMESLRQKPLLDLNEYVLEEENK